MCPPENLPLDALLVFEHCMHLTKKTKAVSKDVDEMFFYLYCFCFERIRIYFKIILKINLFIFSIFFFSVIYIYIYINHTQELVLP
jgi:cellulose synthase/poly-beta-1,6-N-acetylglucosamine synthase-like glycosyltransferase